MQAAYLSYCHFLFWLEVQLSRLEAAVRRPPCPEIHAPSMASREGLDDRPGRAGAAD